VARTILRPGDPGYPSRLELLARPSSVTTSCDLADPAPRVAIVGARGATARALAFTRDLAAHAARAGAIVVSGGAHGVDAAAHEGALDAQGRTWLVAPTYPGGVRPDDHGALYDAIEASAGGVIWTVPSQEDQTRNAYIHRNHVLSLLADVVVVVQAALASGSIITGTVAARYGRPVLVVCGWPDEPLHAGCLQLVAEGRAEPLRSLAHAVEVARARGFVGAPPRPARARADHDKKRRAPPPPSSEALPFDEASMTPPSGLLAHLSKTPQHAEKIAEAAGLPLPLTWTELLTLALEDVVVEAPPGHFRRKN